jgi:hypothetical protein
MTHPFLKNRSVCTSFPTVFSASLPFEQFAFAPPRPLFFVSVDFISLAPPVERAVDGGLICGGF